MIVAGDVGGTSTRLGLFEPAHPRPRAVAVHVFATRDFDSLPAMVAAFMAEPSVTGASIDAGSFGVAGPVVGETAQLTNVSWRIDAREMASAFKWSRVCLLNDLQAMACAVPVLTDSEVHTL